MQLDDAFRYCQAQASPFRLLSGAGAAVVAVKEVFGLLRTYALSIVSRLDQQRAVNAGYPECDLRRFSSVYKGVDDQIAKGSRQQL